MKTIYNKIGDKLTYLLVGFIIGTIFGMVIFQCI